MIVDPVAWLRGRAESYSRDATTFHELEDDRMAMIYRTVADELRQAADAIGATP